MSRISIRRHLVSLGKAILHKLHYRQMHHCPIFIYLFKSQLLAEELLFSFFLLNDELQVMTLSDVKVCVCVCVAERDRQRGRERERARGAQVVSFRHGKPLEIVQTTRDQKKNTNSFLSTLHLHSLLFSYFVLFVPLPSQVPSLCKSCSLSSIQW